MPIEDDDRLPSPIGEADMADAMSLVEEAGWNQTAADWQYMLSAGWGLGFRDADQRLVASSIVLPYPPDIGWIGMVLVRKSHRKRGLATRLLQEAIALCRASGLTPMLDATPEGREVYRRLGFIDGPVIERWHGMGHGVGNSASSSLDLGRAIALDGPAFGADRSRLLADLAGRPDTPAWQNSAATLLGRRGRTATQMGPLLSESEGEAIALCDLALKAMSGPVLIDIPRRESGLRDLLAARGFSVERGFTRMALDKPAHLGAAMRAIAGPELG